MESELEKISQDMFGQSYASLSAFGQYSVRLEVNRNKPIESYEKEQLILRQGARIAELERELKDAWEENEDLQLELLHREEDELRTTGSTRSGETETRGLGSREATSLESIRGRDESGLST